MLALSPPNANNADYVKYVHARAPPPPNANNADYVKYVHAHAFPPERKQRWLRQIRSYSHPPWT